MNQNAKALLALIARLECERDAVQKARQETNARLCELLSENLNYKHELERHARAMRRARLAITSQAERRAFDELYRKNMEKT